MEMMALESFNGDVMVMEGLLDKVKKTGSVSRADVAPYIEHFPIHIALESFTEEASDHNVGMALEGFSVLFKVALGVALAGVIGGIILYLTKSQGSATAAGNNAQQLLKELDLIANCQAARAVALPESQLPPVNSAKLPREADVHIHGMVKRSDTLQGPLLQLKERLRTKVNMLGYEVMKGQFRPFSNTTLYDVRSMVDSLKGQTNDLGKLIGTVERAVESNNIDQLIKQAYALVPNKSRDVLLQLMVKLYDKQLPPHALPPTIPVTNAKDTSYVLDEVTSQCFDLINQRTSVSLSDKLTEELGNLCATGDMTQELFLLRTQATELLKGEVVGLYSKLQSAQTAFQQLKDRNDKVQLPEGLDSALSMVLDSIQRDVKALNRLIDIYSLEVESMLTVATCVSSYMSIDTKVLTRFMMDVDVPAEDRKKFEALVTKALKDYQRR